MSRPMANRGTTTLPSGTKVCAAHGAELDGRGSCWECEIEVLTAEADRAEYEGMEP